jgi:transcriptional regulator with XRE-family HTH domain
METSPIHENIRRRREELGLTQEQLGERAGLSRQQVCQYERGARTPPSRRLQQLAAALEWDLNSLYGSSPSP